MRPPVRWTPILLLIGLPTHAAAAETKAAADTAALESYLHTSLRFVINHGVDLYNGGDVEACYLHFRQTLQQIAPLLGHRAELRKTVETALAEVERNAAWRAKMTGAVKDGNRPAVASPDYLPADRQKAFALRAVLNEVRESLRGGRKAEPPKPPEKLPEADKPGGPEQLKVKPAVSDNK